LDLARSESTVTLSESEMQGSGGPRFAAILQCILMGGQFADSCMAGTLDMSVNGQAVLYTWRIEDERPNRKLIISAPSGISGTSKLDKIE